MTDTQLCLLLAAIWVAPHAGPRYALAVGLIFLCFYVYLGYFQ